jgi:hypothetical protein
MDGVIATKKYYKRTLFGVPQVDEGNMGLIHLIKTELRDSGSPISTTIAPQEIAPGFLSLNTLRAEVF